MRISKFIFGFVLFLSVISFPQKNFPLELFNQVKSVYGEPVPYIGLESVMMDQLINLKSTDAEIQRYIMKYEDLKQKISDYNLEHKKSLENDTDFLINMEDNFSIKERNAPNALACRFGTALVSDLVDIAILNTNANCALENNQTKYFFRKAFYVNKYPNNEKYFYTKFLIERKEYNFKEGEWFYSKVLQGLEGCPFTASFKK